MSTYLLTFTKSIPVIHSGIGDSVTVRTEPWQTTIEANGSVHAEQVAKSIGSHIRVRLGKGYDIVLDSVAHVD